MNLKVVKLIISLLIIVSVLTSPFINSYAADSGKMVIELKIGSDTGKAAGIVSKIERPYRKGGTAMIPLSWVSEAIGAEITRSSDKKIEIIYRDMNVSLAAGTAEYTVNSQTRRLSVAPEYKNDKAMVPIELISKNFPVSVAFDSPKGTIRMVLEDDGALSDLSFLTGGISSPKVGNSYYGWSVSVPSGSRVVANSFKSDRIGISNEGRGLYFEVSAENKDKKTLSDLYSVVQYDNTVRNSKIDLKAAVPYFEYIRLSENDEALRVKVYDKGEYFYYLTINSYDNSLTPEKLMSETYFNNIINSFDLNYKGNVKGVQDLTKVDQGMVYYYNYVSLDDYTKYMPWSINMSAKWNKLFSDKDPVTSYVGLDSRHYMKITMKIQDDQDLDEYTESVKKRYDKYFNPDLYSFISSDTEKITGTSAKRLKFSIKQGGKVNIIDEYYFIKNGFVYEISISLPKEEHDKYIDEFVSGINRMIFYKINEVQYEKDFELYENKNSGARVSQQDDPVEYKMDGWKISLPGYWTKSDTNGFDNPDTGAGINVSTVENTSLVKTLSDKEKFPVMKKLESVYKVTPVQSTIADKGYTIRIYKYNLEDEDSNMFTNITCYCFEAGGNSYCYLSSLPDLTATAEAVADLDNIWKSFNLTK
jgi:hypothetical protein